MSKEDDDREYFFDCFGPFHLAHASGTFSGSRVALRDAMEEVDEKLSKSIGCYLFAIKYGEKITPWYVGMTVARGGFISEVLEPHKRDIYEECMQEQRGIPVLFLFPLLTSTGERYSKAGVAAKPVILWLERMLMGLAYGRNPEIGNLRDMRFLRNVEVIGLLGPKRKGRPHREVQTIRKVLLGKV